MEETLNCDDEISTGGCDMNESSFGTFAVDVGDDEATVFLANGFRFLEKSSSSFSTLWGDRSI
jgi:hypothetical protein